MLTEVESALSIPGVVTEAGLDLPPGLPYEVWATTGERLRDIHKAWNFWFGDWLNYGKDNYPEVYAQMLNVVDLRLSTVNNIMSVARRVPLETRRPELSWGHHEAVAALPAADMQARLDEAVIENLTRAELRDRVKGVVAPPAGECRCHCHQAGWCTDCNRPTGP